MTRRLVVLVVAVLVLVIVVAQSARIYFIQRSQLTEVREQIAQTQEKIAKQRDELNRWNDPEFVKAQARVRLGWVMPGEVGYRVIGPDGQPLDGSEMASADGADFSGPWFERMWKSVEIADAPLPKEESSAPPPDKVLTLPEPSPSATNE